MSTQEQRADLVRLWKVWNGEPIASSSGLEFLALNLTLLPSLLDDADRLAKALDYVNARIDGRGLSGQEHWAAACIREILQGREPEATP